MHYFLPFVFLGTGDNDSCTGNILLKKVMSLIWQTSAFMLMKIHVIFFYYYDICTKTDSIFILEELK